MMNREIKSIEAASRSSYDRVASDYESDQHHTLKFIHKLTRSFLQRHLFPLLRGQDDALVIGSGRNFLVESLLDLNLNVWSCDISFQMLSLSRLEHRQVKYIQCSAFMLPLTDVKFGVALALLGGAYFNDQSVSEICRVLNVNGIAVFSETPKEYVEALQKVRSLPPHIVTMKDATGSHVQLPYPFVYSLSEFGALIERNGFKVLTKVMVEVGDADKDSQFASRLKPIADEMQVAVSNLPLLMIIIARKNG